MSLRRLRCLVVAASCRAGRPTRPGRRPASTPPRPRTRRRPRRSPRSTATWCRALKFGHVGGYGQAERGHVPARVQRVVGHQHRPGHRGELLRRGRRSRARAPRAVSEYPSARGVARPASARPTRSATRVNADGSVPPSVQRSAGLGAVAEPAGRAGRAGLPVPLHRGRHVRGGDEDARRRSTRRWRRCCRGELCDAHERHDTSVGAARAAGGRTGRATAGSGCPTRSASGSWRCCAAAALSPALRRRDPGRSPSWRASYRATSRRSTSGGSSRTSAASCGCPSRTATCWRWPRPMPVSREYTVRRYDPVAGELDVDCRGARRRGGLGLGGPGPRRGSACTSPGRPAGS